MSIESKKERINKSLKTVFSKIPQVKYHSDWPPHIKTSLDYIHAHCYDNSFTMWKLREKICGGKNNNLSSDFSFFIGKPPKSYVIYLRIETSKLLLVKKSFHDIPIYLIARELGFSGNGAFHHAFTESEGISPGKWRKERECIRFSV